MLSQKQIISNKQVKEKLESISPSIKNKTSNSALREIYIEAYNFTIETDSVKYVEDTYNNVHSYNFAISRDSTNSNHIENLLLTLNQDNEYDAYIVEYGFTKTELETLDQNSLSERDVTLTPIDFDISVFNEDELSQKMIFTSDDGEWGYFCDENLVNVNANCNCVPYYVWETDCYWLPIVNPNSGGGDTQHDNTHNDNSAQNNSNPTNNHGGPTSGSIPHSPNTNCRTCPDLSDSLEENNNDDDPCDKLKEYEEDTYIKEQLNLLTPVAENDDNIVEVGVFFKYNNPNWGAETVVGTAENPQISFSFNSPNATIDIFVHTHFKGLLSIFSPGDLQACHQILANGYSANGIDLVFMLITNSGTKYAFKITDLAKFNAIAQEHFQTTDDLNEFASKEYKKIKRRKSNDKNELEFLKMMKKVDLGISLFKANNDFSEWKELALNENEDDVVENDCN